MYRIVSKEILNPTFTMITVEAPRVARKAEPGQFIIMRVSENGERIPLTISDFDRQKGYVSVVFQSVGASTKEFASLDSGDYIPTFVGPLGKPASAQGLSKVAIVCGGIGCAISYPVAYKLHESGCEVHSITGFRSNDYVILEDKFDKASDKYYRVSDDGSWGEKGIVTDVLGRILSSGEKFDEVFAIGPLPMMKAVCDMTREYNLKTIISMNPIMIDGTGMCGGCRLTVGGKMCFACVDGPEFDGHQVDFEEAIMRGRMYSEEEHHAHEKACNLLGGNC